MTLLAETTEPCFAHDAFVYDDDGDYVATLAPLLTDALAAGEHVVAVVPADRAALLRPAVGPRADEVTWVDAAEWYRHPARTIAAYEATLRQVTPGRAAFVVGEVAFGTTESDRLAWTAYESALNRSLARHEARVVCPYDARSLSPTVVRDAARTHRHVVRHDGRHPSEAYVEPESLLRDLAPLAVPPERPADVDMRVGTSVRAGRQAFEAVATAWGLSLARAKELSVAVSEVITNAVVHGRSEAWLRVWGGDGELTCVVADDGEGSDDALLGYVPPTPGTIGGYGLWLTRQLFDRTELARSPSGGLLVLLAVHR